MKRRKSSNAPAAVLAIVLAVVFALPSFGTTVSGAGNHTGLPNNCGFEVPTSPNGGTIYGWVQLKLWNDDNTVIMRVASGPYPVRAKEIYLFAGTISPSSVTLIDTPCAGVVYSHGYDIGEEPEGPQCETDENRPEVADADLVPPGPDLPANTAIVAGGQGDIDFLSGSQGDWGEYWNTFRAHDGELMPAAHGVRRCRYVNVFWITALDQ
jgi:hypothetical protein